jgi:hypothetical protein
MICSSNVFFINNPDPNRRKVKAGSGSEKINFGSTKLNMKIKKILEVDVANRKKCTDAIC